MANGTKSLCDICLLIPPLQQVPNVPFHQPTLCLCFFHLPSPLLPSLCGILLHSTQLLPCMRLSSLQFPQFLQPDHPPAVGIYSNSNSATVKSTKKSGLKIKTSKFLNLNFEIADDVYQESRLCFHLPEAAILAKQYIAPISGV